MIFLRGRLHVIFVIHLQEPQVTLERDTGDESTEVSSTLVPARLP
jgi:hypothetical protein